MTASESCATGAVEATLGARPLEPESGGRPQNSTRRKMPPADIAGSCPRGLRTGYCALMFAALMIGHHFSRCIRPVSKTFTRAGIDARPFDFRIEVAFGEVSSRRIQLFRGIRKTTTIC